MWTGDSRFGRLVSALVVAIGVFLATTALLWLVSSVYGDWLATRPTTPPSAVGGPLTATPSQSSVATPSPTTTPAGPSPAQSTRPTQLASPSPLPSAPVARSVASRVRIEALDIDLPVVSGDLEVPGNPDFYPLCDVAMYLTEFVPPGAQGTTYIYAHAQEGMFLPLLRASEIDDGAAMVGAEVEVFSADGLVHRYEIEQVKRHATDLSIADVAPGQHQLVLQTSEGPTGTVPKLQVAARHVSTAEVGLDEANPAAAPRVCAPD